MKTTLVLLCGLIAVNGCTKAQSDDDGNGSDSGQYVAGFDPPPAPAGYKRYVTAKLTMQPGEDKMFCQWVDVATAQDQDIVDVQGYQTITGHHVIVYSSSEVNPVGENHECTTDDMVSVEFLGGVGGESVNSNVVKLPDGYVFRKRSGRMLMLNVHYLNATDAPQEVQTVVDVKLADESPALKPAGMAVINWDGFTIPANQTYTSDAYCTWPREASLVLWSNHMHEYGLKVKSEVMHADGTATTLVDDTSWKAEQAFNPTFRSWDANAPMQLHAGDKLHISCTWNNTRTTPMGFPDEMCDSAGFYVDSPEQVICQGSPAAQ